MLSSLLMMKTATRSRRKTLHYLPSIWLFLSSHHHHHYYANGLLSGLPTNHLQRQRQLLTPTTSTSTRQSLRHLSSGLYIYFRANEGFVEEEEYYSSSSNSNSNGDIETNNGVLQPEEEDDDEDNTDDDDDIEELDISSNNKSSPKKLNTQQAKALQSLISSFPYAYENAEDFSELSLEQSDALQALLSSFPNTGSNNNNNNNNGVFSSSSLYSSASPASSSNTGSGNNNNNNYDNDSDDDQHTLSPKQQEALQAIKDGHNVFITGVAGTGKSLVLHKALEYFRDKYDYDNKKYVAVAPTGPTALALAGQTIHSFAGIGIPKTQDNFSKTRTKKDVAKRWQSLNVMILDECSMISGEFLDRLSKEVCIARKDYSKPFGGVQLVLCGDFLQLPPIRPSNQNIEQERRAMQQKGRDSMDLFSNAGFAFESYSWKNANIQMIELDVVYRQKNNIEYINMLQEIRNGRITKQETMDFIKKCQRPLPPNEFGIRPTLLHCRNKDVSIENMQELNKLPGEAIEYEALDSVVPESSAGSGARNQLKRNAFFKNCIAEKSLQLKLGAEVLLVKNLPASRLVNGSRGKVVNFRRVRDPQTDKMVEYPVVQFVNGVKKMMEPQLFESRLLGLGTCKRLAIPLKLAWAITTHKSQGLTLDYVVADVGGVFGEAQAYVALSRATDQNGLELRNFSPNKVRSNPVALAFYENPNQNFPTWDRGQARNEFDTSGMQQPAAAGKNNNNNNSGTSSSSVAAAATGQEVDRSKSIEAIILSKRTVPELKEMLKDRGLKATGRKAELVDRLCASSSSSQEF